MAQNTWASKSSTKHVQRDSQVAVGTRGLPLQQLQERLQLQSCGVQELRSEQRSKFRPFEASAARFVANLAGARCNAALCSASKPEIAQLLLAAPSARSQSPVHAAHEQHVVDSGGGRRLGAMRMHQGQRGSIDVLLSTELAPILIWTWQPLAPPPHHTLVAASVSQR